MAKGAPMASALGVIVMQILIVSLIKAVVGGEGKRSEADTDRTACTCPRQEFSHPILHWRSGALGDLDVFERLSWFDRLRLSV